jgi:hypothetical protein
MESTVFVSTTTRKKLYKTITNLLGGSYGGKDGQDGYRPAQEV